MYYNRYRYFDPNICAYASQDPLGLLAGENVYCYPWNSFGYTDPLGLCPKSESGGSKPKSPSEEARNWQGKGDYPGVDNWKDTTLKKGTAVWGGAPGQSNFYTTNGSMKSVNTNATKLYDGLQVGKGAYPEFRPGMTKYIVNQDISVATSKALANPMHGNGGFDQYYIQNFENVLEPVKTLLMTNL